LAALIRDVLAGLAAAALVALGLATLLLAPLVLSVVALVVLSAAGARFLVAFFAAGFLAGVGFAATPAFGDLAREGVFFGDFLDIRLPFVVFRRS
jgi:hypothetical protein